jgi:pyridoxamine 5'-phosphate oxidase
MSDLYKLRKEYTQQGLSREVLNPHPVKQFFEWFNDAINTQLEEPNAMVLSTVDKNNRPSSRIVLLKDFNETGFTFFTNYSSRKGNELFDNPYASLLFPWFVMQRQLRIEGKVGKLSSIESDTYFNERPFGSQIGAWASPQSTEIPSREFLDAREANFRKKYEGKLIPRPSNWGGYRLVPDRFEFWQRRENRLHDRFEYYLEKEEWKIRRLAP